MKRLLPLLLFGLVLTGNVAPAAAQVTAQSADSLYAVYLLSVVVPQPDVAHYVVAYAHLLEGTPYAAGSLDRDSVEQLQAHLQETDCTIFVETVLALARTALAAGGDCCLLVHNSTLAGDAEWQGWAEMYPALLRQLRALEQDTPAPAL